ncbi:MAG: hypothetical protein ACLPVF_14370 [Acidimicrobiales bacterium]
MPDRGSVSDKDDTPDVTIRLLRPNEAPLLSDAIRAAYGETYDVPWVYDGAEVGRRIAQGTLLSAVALDHGGGLLCHAALTRHSSRDLVVHAGQAVTVPAAQGHHLFPRVKSFLSDLALHHGLVGMYSEVTAAHPYSERANIDLGGHETGFLLGWIPGSVANEAAGATRGRRQSAALFYLKLRAGHTRPVYAPAQHRAIVHTILRTCGLRGRLAEPARDLRLPDRTHTHIEPLLGHNAVQIHVTHPGADLGPTVAAIRARLFGEGIDVLYVDLPLDVPSTALVADHVAELGLSFSGIFPNTQADGDVLRLQSLNQVIVRPDDIEVASEHGRALLDYVLDDLGAARTA